MTAAAALEAGKYQPDTVVPGPAELTLPLTSRPLKNWTGQRCGPDDKTTLTNALAVSCNTAFAAIGMSLGDDALREQAEKFGFNTLFRSRCAPRRADSLPTSTRRRRPCRRSASST